MDLHDIGDTNHAGHHCEITDRTEFELIVQSRIDGIGREHDEERVAVRRRSHHRFGGKVARGARTVLDKERLTEALRQPLTDQTRHDVDRAARGKPKHHADRPHRIRLCAGCPRDGREGGGTCRQLQKSTAWKFHGTPAIAVRRTESEGALPMSGVPLCLLSSPHYTNARRIDMTGTPTLPAPSPYLVKADHGKFAGFGSIAENRFGRTSRWASEATLQRSSARWPCMWMRASGASSWPCLPPRSGSITSRSSAVKRS